MRIVGGRLGGRTLLAPKSQAIRPTSDRLREALFNVLQHAYAAPVSGARVLDLLAGTGAMGLEALSRGAAFVLFVDDGAEARALLRGNVDALGAGGASKVYRRDATRLGPCAPLSHGPGRCSSPTRCRAGLDARAMPSIRPPSDSTRT